MKKLLYFPLCALFISSLTSSCGPKGVSTSGAPFVSKPEKIIRSSEGITKDEVEKKITSRMRHIKYCYEEVLEKDPNLKGKITYKFVIFTHGKIDSISVQGSTIKNVQVESCIQYELTKIQFPTFEKGSLEVVYPFILRTTL